MSTQIAEMPIAIQHSESQVVDTRITDCWGVEWSPMEIARDFLQNFYDENPIDTIKIDIDSDTVIVSAPAEFDYNELLYMGSDKGQDKIGQYGEGFKAATLNAMRNHHCLIEMTVKGKRLSFFFENKIIGRSEKKVVMCEITPAKSENGTKLIIRNCPALLSDEFKFGLNYFYHDGNPLLGALLAKAHKDDILVFKSIDKQGYVFYKNLMRAKQDIPLVLVCNRQYKSINEKIKHDRDRKAFDDDVLNKLLRLMCRPLSHGVEAIVNELEPWWGRGHKLLSALAGSVRYNFKMTFPDNYYARSSERSSRNNYDMLMKIQSCEEEWNKKGYVACPNYMSKLGMKTAYTAIEKKESEIKEKHKKIHTRDLTELEHKAISILNNTIQKINPKLSMYYENAEYTVGDSDEILGELKENRSLYAKHVYLSKQFFTFDFSEAMAVLLHEWGHIRGYDGSRSFTDALTELISYIIRNRGSLERPEKEWEQVSTEIGRQRDINNTSGVYDYIDCLTSDEKSMLLRGIPEDQLLQLFRKADIL